MNEQFWTERFQTLSNSLADPTSPLSRQLAFFRAVVTPGGGELLDIGCAWGWIPLQLARAGLRVSAVDWDEERIRYAKDKAAALNLAVDFQTADAVSWAPSRSFTIVRSGFMLDHLTSKDQTLASAERFASWVAPGGALFMSFCGPGDDLNPAEHHRAADGTLAFHSGPHADSHWRYWSDAEIESLVDRRRFSIEAFDRNADGRGARFVFLRRLA